MFETIGNLSNGRTRKCGSILLVALLAAPLHLSAAATFRGIGDSAGEGAANAAQAVSPDGSTVVGQIETSNGFEAFRWTEADGFTTLGFVSGAFGESNALGCSADGSVVVGESSNSSGEMQGFRWELGTGMVGLDDVSGGAVQGAAFGVSSDGSVIVGIGQSDSGDEAIRWDSGADPVIIHDDLSALRMSGARAVSADGQIVAGYGYSQANSGVFAFIWTQAGSLNLGVLPGAASDSYANDVSDVGDVAAGWSLSETGPEAFRWTIDDGMIGLGVLPGDFLSEALAVSADGALVVGRSFGPTGNRAFIWEESMGIVPMSDFLTANGIDHTGWMLTQGVGLSADGARIVGNGINPVGELEAWIVDLGTGDEGGGDDEPVDSDGDGIADDEDAVPNSDMSPTVVISGFDSRVANMVLPDGSTLADVVAAEEAASSSPHRFLDAVNRLAHRWNVDGYISRWDRWSIWQATERARWELRRKHFRNWWHSCRFWRR